LDDYAAVRELVSDVVSEGVEATVPTTVRETVEAVSSLLADVKETVAQSDLRKVLELDRGVISRRVRAACDRGYLKNLEDRKGRSACLKLGDPMPDEIDVLPSLEALSEALLQRCSDGAGGTKPPPSPDEEYDNEREVISLFLTVFYRVRSARSKSQRRAPRHRRHLCGRQGRDRSALRAFAATNRAMAWLIRARLRRDGSRRGTGPWGRGRTGEYR
jgi:hypothetical protein